MQNFLKNTKFLMALALLLLGYGGYWYYMNKIPVSLKLGTGYSGAIPIESVKLIRMSEERGVWEVLTTDGETISVESIFAINRSGTNCACPRLAIPYNGVRGFLNGGLWEKKEAERKAREGEKTE